MTTSGPEILRLAYASSYDQLQSQKDDLRSIRGHASLSIAFVTFLGTFGATFLGPDGIQQIFSHSGDVSFLSLSVLGTLLLSVLGASLALSILVVTSVESCVFSLNTDAYRHFVTYPAAEEDSLIYFVSEMDKHFDANESVISNARGRLSLALALGWSQLVVWVLLWGEASNGV